MTEEEQEQLHRVIRSPKVMVLRFTGLLAGLAGLALAATFFLGVPYVSSVYVVEAPLVGIFAVALAGAAALISRGPRESLKQGAVVDLQAPVTTASSAPRNLAGVTIGPWTLLVPVRVSSWIHPGSIQRMAVATGSGVPAMRFPVYGLVSRGVLLSVDGQPLPSPPVVYFDPDSVASFPVPTAPAT
ncbi:MAG: hypothetical protein WAN40_00305 [Thermoplasmata archaeon]